MEFVGSKEEQLVLSNWSTNACPSTGVVEAVLVTACFFQVVHRVVIAVLVVSPSRTMQIVSAGLCCGRKKPPGGVPVFRAELVGEQCEFSHRILNDRLRRAIHIHAVIVHPVNGETIETWPSPPH